MMRVLLGPLAARQVQRERVWLVDHRGPLLADDFEGELRRAMELLAECPHMGNAIEGRPERHWFLRRSRFHVYYRVYAGDGVIVVMRLRHEKQRPLK